MGVKPPQSEQELFNRARSLTGRRLSEIATDFGLPVPDSPVRSKGWTGNLLEAVLGATAASLPEPDFQAIGVELKSIPVNDLGRPKESTYICAVPVPGAASPLWEDSSVRRKLARVLWIPVVSEAKRHFTERRIGAPLLWSPTEKEEVALRADWEELMDMVYLGRIDDVTARHGTYLQIRPKAANSAARQQSIGPAGTSVQTLPRGFYLRTGFTAALIARHYARAR